MSDISIREQREAVERATHDAVDHGIAGDTERLPAAIDTLAKVERGELVPKRGLTQEQIDDIGIPHFPSDYDRP